MKKSLRARRLVASLVAGAAVAALGAPPASAADGGQLLGPRSVPREGRAHSLYLVGRDIHRPDGTIVHVPLARGAAPRLTLMGPATRGWVVHSHVDSPTERFYRVHDGRATQFAHWGDEEGTDVYRLSRTGTSMWDWAIERDLDQTVARLTRLDGTSDHAVVPGGGVLLDVAGWGMVASTAYTPAVDGPRATATWRWKPGSAPQKVDDRAANFASVGHDVLAVQVGDSGWGPTSLRSPGEPAWSAHARMLDVSPDGAHVVSLDLATASSAAPTLLVQRLSDGTVLERFRVRGLVAPLVWWEKGAIVFQTKNPRTREKALLRCTVDGVCRRVTDVLPLDGARFSIPFRNEGGAGY